MLAHGRALCAILDYIKFFARRWPSLVCRPRSHSVWCSPLVEPCVPSSITFSFTLAPWQSLVCHSRLHSVLRSPLAEHCMPSSISFSFSLAPGRALCAIFDYIQFFARPWQSLVCHLRLHSVLCSPLVELWVPSWISFSFMLAPGKAFCAILDYIQF